MFCSSQAGDRTATGMWKTETEKLKFVVQTGCKFFLIYQCLGHNSDCEVLNLQNIRNTLQRYYTEDEGLR